MIKLVERDLQLKQECKNRRKYVLMLGGDGATDIKDYNLLFKSVKEEESYLAIGIRKISEQAELVRYRNIMGIFNNCIINICISISFLILAFVFL